MAGFMKGLAANLKGKLGQMGGIGAVAGRQAAGRKGGFLGGPKFRSMAREASQRKRLSKR